MKPRVYLIETGSALDRMLSFFFAHWAKNVALVPAEQAEVAIIDYDAPKAASALEQFRKRAPFCPVIALAYQPPAGEQLLHLPKPVTLEQLEKYFNEAPWQAPQREPQPTSESLEVQGPEEPPVGLASKTTGPTWPEEPSSKVWNPPSFAEGLYDARCYLQGWLQKAYRQVRLTHIPVRLALPEGALDLYPREQIVVTSFPEEALVDLCSRELEGVTLKAAPETLLAKRGQRNRSFPIQGFLWQVALYCARGRLEQTLASHELFWFKRWPNLTRWLRTPSALAIVAFYYNEPHRIEEATDELAVPQEEVHTLLSAAAALDLLAFPEREAPPIEVPRFARQERRTLIGFLKRLLGL